MTSPRPLRLTALALVAGLLLVLIGAGSAQAAPTAAPAGAVMAAAGGDGSADNPFGFELTDSRGISVWDMNLSVSKGSSWNPGDWDKRMWASVMDGAWASYRIVTAVEIWVLNWSLSLSWMDWILSPMRGLSELVGDFMDQLGLMPLMLIILAVVGSWWLLRGRYAGGLVELLLGCVIASLALGALSDPMETIAGDNGMLMQGRDAGIELASAVASGDVGGAADVDQYRNGLTTALVDSMVRIPHQVINYGQVIDGTSCESTYDAAVAGEDAQSQLASCNEQLGAYADNPDAMKGMTVLSVLPTAYFLFIFSMLVVTLVLVTVLGAAWTAVRLVPQLVMGVVPGSSRAALSRSLAMALFAMFMLTCSIVFVVVWMQLLEEFFGSSSGLPWMVRIYLVDILLVVGGVVLWLFRSKAKRAFKNVADRLARLGGSSMAPEPSHLPRLPRMRMPRLPQGGPGPRSPLVGPGPGPGPAVAPVADAARTAASIVGAGASVSSARGVRQLVAAGGRPALPPAPPSRPGPPRPGGRPALPAGPGGGGAAAARVRGRIAQGASLAIQVGAAAATSGGSAVAGAATKRAITAGGAKAAAATTAKNASTAAGRAASMAALRAAQTTGNGPGASTTGAAARAARAARSDQVRARLRAVQMRHDGDRVVDEQTGRSYTVRPAATPGVQILQPSGEQRRRRRGGAA
ncbi:hypothetical protein [Cellulomonas marina]|uniref:TrbL/VirB6 plasmid conjugal transfer protein n=1 Tax=Cellulomonas marina TaxID=988821 RepID=A0A1I1ARN8_9CELL|nr:hypothetical protein [Cellulomonas marina]GIG29291.1 hypothetical protein Cma02nite_18910 [Cellulomonas marina]SFB40162.1 hypothetical protein SAMN05421867_12132 [Cellulomonas marina]